MQQFVRLNFASNEHQLLAGVSFEGIERAGLSSLERVFELSLDWRKVNTAFIELAQAFLDDPSGEVLETQKRIIIACTSATENLASEISLRALPRINLLINSVEMIIESLSASHKLNLVDEFNQLPLAYLTLAQTLSLKRPYAEKLEDVQTRIVMSLAQRVVPDLLALGELAPVVRNGLTQVVRALLSKDSIFDQLIEQQSELKRYWSDVFFLAEQCRSQHLHFDLLNISGYLWEHATSGQNLVNQGATKELLSESLSALAVSGKGAQSEALFREILEIYPEAENIWYQAFIGLSIASLGASWDQLSNVLEQALRRNEKAEGVLLEYLRLPGAALALKANFPFCEQKHLILELAARYQQAITAHDNDLAELRLFSKSEQEEPGVFSETQRKALATVFEEYGWKL